jgi:hypothetical protein
MEVVIVNLLILLANVAVLGLSLKLYTEYFKDWKIERRKKNDYRSKDIN